ncbi:cohesin complex subunit psm1 [Microstroma glucosiphilum]|uniref:Structural maintenance of chromosomes protein n=1 Tax=Pseudomicrostroma glucosiphilum TaxID=1684307 RepID=A0A316UE39_9BASI|nr:cohesin complex subunit psm1 [Pseudomicrostroma glucosiphilum]PWN23168.1 cohesin complex subunit psm1 [Pseudomicrostroma glucosiphilum]
MPLLRLEVDNFKSYRGQQIIGPFQSFSAIIGPNGSGKSNLMDAISFVLGVKSAQLRSSQLRDVIFRGRRMDGDDEVSSDDEGGRSSADATKASVTAVYEDTSGREWRFQRSINLNGASEYRVNGRVTSYNSYNATLEKFRILVKAKNFLVFQGDVEAVASQNSRDLAKLVDQISGSLELKEEYEQAKERMERSQEESASAFHKRRGINGELKTFREQKNEAEKWERMQEERDAHILQLLLWQLYHIAEKLQSAERGIQEQNGELPSLRRQQGRKEKDVEAQRKEAASALREVSKAERDIKAKEKEIEEKQPTLDAIDERTAHSQRRIAAATTIITDVERDVRERGAGMSLSEADLEEYHDLRAEASTRKASERQQLDTLKRQLRAQQTTLQSLEDKAKQLERAQDKLEGETEVAQEKKAALESRRTDLESKLQEARAQLNTLQAERTRIGKRETELNDTLQTCYTKLIQAGNEARESEREAKMKETFTALAKIFPGVKGRLVDLCKPTQHKYDIAITTVLGRNTDAIIVEREKTAIDCIEYLRNQRAGQATFLPLDTIQAKPINDRLRSVAKGARLAIDVIQFDASLERAMQYVCGNALVCDSMQVARDISYEKAVDAKTVTLDGTIIHRSGLITGGQSDDRGGKRFEEREVQGLQRQKQQCMDELKALAVERRALLTEESLVARIGECETQLTALNDDISAATSRLTGLQTEFANVKKQIRDNRPKVETARSTAESTQSQMNALTETVNADDDELFASFCERIGVADIREYEERQLQVLERQKDARLEFETQMKRLEHQIKFIRSQITAQEERLSQNRRVVEKESDRLQRIAEEKTEAQQAINEIRADIGTQEGRLTALRTTSDEKAQTLSDAKKELSKASKALDGVMKEVATLNDQMERLAAQRTEIYRRCRLEEIDLPLLKGSLSKVSLEDNPEAAPMDIDDDVTQRAINVPDFGLDVDFSELEDAAKEDGGAGMEAELKDQIDKVVGQIEKMAPNMKAADRLGDTEARFKETEREFETSRKESVAAKTAFNDIKKRRCDLFNKAFNHISGRIDSVYKDLTKGKAAPAGGVAYLSLEDTEEPYLSGVKYHAMPPMKRFRDMDQLSGGEKTMAALALLFCVATFAPPPFFVLDEVDAALDSQNVAKVAAYIRSRARPEFQFIVISLKASLYERAEGLVGVYRKTEEDQNSSASLTLDLEKYQ